MQQLMRYWTWTAAFPIRLQDPDQCRHCFNDRHKPPTSRLSHIYAVGSRGFTAANRGPGWCPVVVLQGVKIVGACIHVHNERHVTKDDGTTGHIGSMGKGGIRKTLLITTYLGILSTRVGQGRHALGICPWLLCATGATGIWGVGARYFFLPLLMQYLQPQPLLLTCLHPPPSPLPLSCVLLPSHQDHSYFLVGG